MCHGGDLDRRKEVFSKMASFGVIPGKHILVKSHEVVHEITFFGQEETRWVTFVNNFTSFNGVAAIWCERRRMWRKNG